MRRNSTSSIGAFHPILFFVVVYGISLFLAIFVCRTVYNSLHEESASSGTPQTENYSLSATSSISATALR